MNHTEKTVRLATQLYDIGIAIDKYQKTLQELIDHGMSIDSPEVLSAALKLEYLRVEFQTLESEYIELQSTPVTTKSRHTNTPVG